MTEAEYRVWSKELFIAFPSLWDWLQTSSPDPKQTQVIWRKCLEPYTFDECHNVVEEWATGAREPFEAYERDKLHLRVRARIEQARDRQRKKSEMETAGAPYREKRKQGSVGKIGGFIAGDASKAIEEGAKEHRKFKDGEIDWDEYVLRREEILTRNGFNT